MHSDSDSVIRAETRAQGLRIKRNNLVAALLSGLTLVLISVEFVAPSRAGFLFGLLVGFVYANGFEYCLHRFLLHCGQGVFSQQHMVHHTTLKSPDSARYVNFSSNPWGVVALFCVNALPFLVLERIFKNGWVAGAFVSFALYYIAFEEIHWRTHMGGWLPAWLRAPGDTTLTIRDNSTCSCQCSIGLYGKYRAGARTLASGENYANSFLNTCEVSRT